jgi:hypothetical protein
LFILAENIVFAGQSNVLLFINYEEANGTLEGKYLLRKGRMEEESPLFKEGGFSKRERLDLFLD